MLWESPKQEAVGHSHSTRSPVDTIVNALLVVPQEGVLPQLFRAFDHRLGERYARCTAAGTASGRGHDAMARRRPKCAAERPWSSGDASTVAYMLRVELGGMFPCRLQ